MFDNVGMVGLDAGARRRDATAAVVVSLVAAMIAGALVGMGMWTLHDRSPDVDSPFEVEPLIELTLADPLVDIDVPSLPRRAGGAQVASEVVQEAGSTGTPEPEPDEPPAEASTQSEADLTESAPEVAPSAKLGGDGALVGGDGPGEGTVGLGDPDGTCVGVACGVSDGPRVVHHSVLEVRRRGMPAYPSSARGMGLGEQRCRATVYIDERGTPGKVTVAACPAVFHNAVRDGLMRWRWYPPRVDGVKGAVQTLVLVRFREQ